MPGRLVDGLSVKNYKRKANQVYGEGMARRLVSATAGTNPYLNDLELKAAWDAGFEYVNGLPAFTVNANNNQGFALSGVGPTPV
jgi:hypothetical protein